MSGLSLGADSGGFPLGADSGGCSPGADSGGFLRCRQWGLSQVRTVEAALKVRTVGAAL